MTVDELYQRARDLDIHCRSNMNKEELIEAIEGKGDHLTTLSKNELTRKARELDIHGRSKMNRNELVRAIRDREGKR
jgi:hypothetical protein